MELLPVEMLNEILLQVDTSTLFDAAQVCKQWRHLALKQVVPIKTYQDFKSACTIGDRLSIIQSKCVQSWINGGLNGACRSGHQALVQLMITKGANDWNGALYSACLRGHQALVQLMITQGADNWNNGLIAACEAGHQALVQLMIAKGADRCSCRKSLALH